MHTFQQLVKDFANKFDVPHFPASPHTLYDPGNYFLTLGGKRIRPVMCLMGHELFTEITADTYNAATAIELFHNFTLLHDDIMDKAPLRRGVPTVHTKYGENTALLTGDVMMIVAYEYLNKIESPHKTRIFSLFNRTAKEVCEGQQLDMDFESRDEVSMQEYIRMTELKTSVLLAASLKTGTMLGGATEGNCNLLYEFGRNLGIAFQIQDDYLDAFGDPAKFGKDVGGDIRQNKKTFLHIQALETANEAQKSKLQSLMRNNPTDKVQQVLSIFKDCNIDNWANELKLQYLNKALQCLEEVAVVSSRKNTLRELADFLIQREQ